MTSAPPEPDELRRPARRKLHLLLAPVLLLVAARALGVALAPALLERAPIALFLMAPVGRHLVLVSPDLDLVTFVLVGVVGYFLADPFNYLLGREYGHTAVAWIERRSGTAGRWARAFERLFQRAGPLVVFVAPSPIVNLMAGAARMRVALWLPLNLTGTLVIVLLTRWFGEMLAAPILALREFISEHVVALTVASAVLVLVTASLRRRQLRKNRTE